ncbi:MAG: hypothetical protein KC468_31075, partial [Myxococcales bacterium]|nr:hypothetical protein [Myxococcales bacterium]
DAEDGFEDEDEDDEEEERTWSMRLSTWLRFGLPAAGEHERFLLDWRHQWYVVFAGASIVECFAGIYGMSGAQRRALETRDRQVWRAFLRELVDPRFPG